MINTIKTIQNNISYVQILQKNLFARVMNKEDISELNRFSNIFLTSLQQMNGAKTIGYNKLDTFVLDSIIPEDSQANNLVSKAFIEVFFLPLLPVGLITKFATLLNNKDREELFRATDLQFKEIEKPMTIIFKKQENEIGKLPKCLKKILIQQLDVKSISHLNLLSKEWYELTKPELEYRSLHPKLQELIGRTTLEKLLHIKIPLHRAGIDQQKNPVEYFTQPFDSTMVPTTSIKVEPSMMENQSIALGRDPWGRIYLALHLCYNNQIEASLVIHPETLKEASSWVGHEVIAGNTLPKNSLQTHFSRGFTEKEESLHLLERLINGQTVHLDDVEVRLWLTKDSSSFRYVTQIFKRSIFI